MLFVSFWRRIKSYAKLAIQSQMEYRLNLAMDATIQPIITAVIETAMWYALFSGMGINTLNGFSREYYLAYMMWAAFFSRISANWMYEFRMMEEIESGSINSVLTRPMGFYEFYLGQFMGYKLLTTLFSMFVPILVFSIIQTPTELSRFPLALALTLYYLIFVYTLSFCIVCLSFFLTRVHSFTVAKNFSIWILSGELFPLDLVPGQIKNILISLPFANAVYIPVGYLTQRHGIEMIWTGFQSVTLGLLVLAPLAAFLWKKGNQVYMGTGA